MTCYFYLARRTALLGPEKARLSRRLSSHTIDHWVVADTNEVQSTAQSHCLKNFLQHLTNGDTLIVERLQDFGCGPLEAIVLIKSLLSRMIGIVVLEVDERNLAASENSAVIRMLEAITRLDPKGFNSSASRNPDSACRPRRKSDDLVRETIITKYSLGESVTSIARQYNVSRSAIAKIVQPTREYDPVYQRAFGD